MKNRRCIVISIGALIILMWAGGASGQLSQSIGNVTAVQPDVNVTHEDRLEAELVKLGNPVLFKDLYVTKAKSRLKLLFEDDSLLSLGENTQLQITENIFNPTQNRRSTIIDVLNGTVRALVGKIFTGGDSRFEIHTPTAVAAVRGTYFIIWTVEVEEDDNDRQIDVYFDLDNAIIREDVRRTLEENARWLVAHPDATVILEGHADERNTNKYNLALGESRANAIKRFLIALGIDEERLSTISYGEDRPICLEKTEECHVKNRRVHFTIPKQRKAISTGVVNIGESGTVEVRNIDPAIEGSVELEQYQYTMTEEGKPPSPPAIIDPDLLSRLLDETAVSDQMVDEVPKAPDSDVFGEEVIAIGSEQVATHHAMPPIPQQPFPTGAGAPSLSGVNVEIQFP